MKTCHHDTALYGQKGGAVVVHDMPECPICEMIAAIEANIDTCECQRLERNCERCSLLEASINVK